MLEIRKISTIEEYQQLPGIQMSAWGFAERDAEPHHLMTRVQKYGGLVQGIFHDGVLAGFTYAVIGRWEGEYFWYSHMAAVRREFQGRGFGRMLKLAQREAALAQGFRIIRWSFDPLEALNSFFNLHRLGAICREYERDVYGSGSSGLHQGLPTDRLVAEWRLDSERVVNRIGEMKTPLRLQLPDPLPLDFSTEMAWIEIPRDVRTMKQHDLSQARAWRQETRQAFETAFASGFEAEELVFSPDDRRVFYQLFRRR